MIDLYWWNDAPNFGDALSEVIVGYVTSSVVKHVPKESSPKLLTVGSILQLAKDGDTVWGSGLHPWAFHRYARPMERPPSLNILAVRGPLTYDALKSAGIGVSETFGDPAILLPLYHKDPVEKNYEVGLVPHIKDIARGGGDIVINPRDHWKTVVDQIRSCKRIISSSLHGIIIAEAYGIPAVWLRTSTYEGASKYYDYYLSTERYAKPVYSLDKALLASPPNLPKINKMQSRLILSAKGIGK